MAVSFSASSTSLGPTTLSAALLAKKLPTNPPISPIAPPTTVPIGPHKLPIAAPALAPSAEPAAHPATSHPVFTAVFPSCLNPFSVLSPNAGTTSVKRPRPKEIAAKPALPFIPFSRPLNFPDFAANSFVAFESFVIPVAFLTFLNVFPFAIWDATFALYLFNVSFACFASICFKLFVKSFPLANAF